MLCLRTGVTHSRPGEFTEGYLLLAPGGGNQVFLIDYHGNCINEWRGKMGLTHWAYLLPNGNLFVNECSEHREGVVLTTSGLMREYDWNSNLVHELVDP